MDAKRGRRDARKTAAQIGHFTPLYKGRDQHQSAHRYHRLMGVGVNRVKNNTHRLLTRAKLLRKNSTDAENKLWFYLRNRQLGNLKFRRQVPVGNYVTDFLCPEKRLIVELDGGQHAEQKQEIYDEKRRLYLNRQGFSVLRFWNNQIFEEIEVVLDEILRTANLIRPPHPNPLPRNGGEGEI